MTSEAPFALKSCMPISSTIITPQQYTIVVCSFQGGIMKLRQHKRTILWSILIACILYLLSCGVTDSDGDTSSANVPEAPVSFEASSGTNTQGILCTWQIASTGLPADSICIYRSFSSDNGYTLLVKVPISETSYLDASAEKGRVFYYRVTAKNNDGESAPSQYDEGHVGESDGNEISTPQNIQIVFSSTGFHVSWHMEKSTNITHYNINKYTDTALVPYDTDTLLSSAVIPGTNPGITDSVGEKDIFYYRITAFDNQGNSASSPFYSVNVALIIAEYLPDIPLNLQASQGTIDNAIVLTWQMMDENHEGYILYTYTAMDQTPVVETLSISSAEVQYVKSHNTEDTLYFKLSTFNFAGESARSESVIGFAKKKATQFEFTLQTISLSPTTAGIRCNSSTADSYTFNLYRSETLTGSYSLISSVPFDSVYVDSQLTAATSYYYKAVAYFSKDTSAMSNALTVMTLPDAPVNLQVSEVNSHTALLNWEGTSSTGYTVYLVHPDTKIDTFVVPLEKKLQLPDSTLLPNSSYKFWLLATPPTDVIAEPALSDTSSFTTLYRYNGTLTASTDNASGIVLSWNRLIVDGIVAGNQYTQLYKRGPGETTFTLYQDQFNDTTLTDKQIISDSSYAYYIIVRTPTNLSESSDTITGIQPGFDQPDSLWGINNQTGKITLLWKKVAAAQSYTLLRSTERNGTFVEIAAGLTDTTAIDANVYNGLDYYYAVKAVSSTNIESEMTKGAFNYHSDPQGDFYVQNLKGTVGTGSITLTWEASSAPGVTYSDHSYIILRGEGSSSKVLDTLTAPTVTYLDESVVAGTNYRYSVVARVIIDSQIYTSGFGASASNLIP